MKQLILLVILFFSSLVSGEKLAFIGAPLSVERSEKSCKEYIGQPSPDSGLEVICMDRVFKLKYKVEEFILSNSSSEVVNFVDFYHYRGMPDYTQYEPALVIVSTELNHMQLIRIDPVERIDNEWQVCVEWHEEEGQCVERKKASEIVNETFKKI